MSQLDEGEEFDYLPLFTLLLKHGILFRKSCLDSQQSNRVSEQKHRHVWKIIKSSLIDASMPMHFLLDTVFTVGCTINNHLPIALLQSPSPFETLFARPPNYGFLKLFGHLCLSRFVPR